MDEVTVGLSVSTADDEVLGKVKEVVGDRFKVDVRFNPDYWLSKTTVGTVAGGQVKLNVTKSQLGEVQEGLARSSMTGNFASSQRTGPTLEELAQTVNQLAARVAALEAAR